MPTNRTESDSRPVVFITGAAGGGIGTSSAIRFAQAGYDVVATDIKRLEGIQRDVENLGAKCLTIHLDVCNSESVQGGMSAMFRVNYRGTSISNSEKQSCRRSTGAT